MEAKHTARNNLLLNSLNVAVVSYLLLVSGGKALAKPTPPSPFAQGQTAVKDAEAAIAGKSLRRLDFRVVGKSCAVCLLGIQRKIKTIKGVVKMAVMLKPPYGAVVLYDGKKTAPHELLDTAKKGEKDVKFEDIKDVAINRVPLVLVPVHNTLKDNKGSLNAGLPLAISGQSRRAK